MSLFLCTRIDRPPERLSHLARNLIRMHQRAVENIRPAVWPVGHAERIGLQVATSGRIVVTMPVVVRAIRAGTIDRESGSRGWPSPKAYQRYQRENSSLPMATVEPSVVAAASNMASVARIQGGFHASSDQPIMISQIQVVGAPDPHGARLRLY